MFFLFVFVLGCIAFEIRMFNAIKKAYIFCLACAITAFENSGVIIYISVEQWWTKLVIQVLVEYQVPNFEMAIYFELKLEYGKYAYNWNRQTAESEKWQEKLIRFNFKP